MNDGTTLRVALVVSGVVAVVALAVWGTDSSEAVFGFLGVLVGALLTVGVETLRSREARREGQRRWKLDALARFEKAADAVEDRFSAVMEWRENELRFGKHGYRQMPMTDQRMIDIQRALRALAFAEGEYLGADLHAAATKYRTLTFEMLTYEPPALQKPIADMTPAEVEAVLAETEG